MVLYCGCIVDFVLLVVLGGDCCSLLVSCSLFVVRC